MGVTAKARRRKGAQGISRGGAKTRKDAKEYKARRLYRTVSLSVSLSASLASLWLFTVHLVQCFGAVLYVELVVYFMNVLAYCAGADAQLCSDFFI